MGSVIYIMWLRQLKRYFRSRWRVVGSLGRPLLFLLIFGFGFGPVYRRAGGGDYMDFLAPGIIAMAILFTAVFTGIELIWDRRFGFLKETFVAPVPRTAIMAGKTLGGATVAVIQGLVVLLMTLLVGFRPADLARLPLAFLIMALTAVVFASLGMAIASRMDDMHAFPLVMNFLVMPLFFLSGALFPLEGLPTAMNALIRANPMTYAVDGLRLALTGAGQFSFVTDISVLLASGLILIAVGTALFRRIEA